MRNILQAVWWLMLQVATWVWLLAAASLQGVDDSDMELLQQAGSRTRPLDVVRDKVASGIAGRSLSHAVERFAVHPHYDPSVDQLSPQQQRVLKTVLVDGAVEWLGDVLRARPMATPIKFERACWNDHTVVHGVKYCNKRCSPVTHCGPVSVPEDHQAPCRRCLRPGQICTGGEAHGTVGVKNAHFLLYVSALPESHCRRATLYAGTSLVQAGHCLQEEEFDRPVAGYINFCPEALSTKPADLPIQQSAVLHQLLHALVFSQELFPYFHNDEGYPRSRRTADGSVVRYPVTGQFEVDPNTVRQVRRTNWTILTPHIEHTVTMVVTPNVVREVRDHFNCSTLVGAELENQGGVGVAGVHWENRVFGEELMTGVLGSVTVLSRVTLALLHDSGWYVPDYRYGEQLHWGRGKGCVFVEESCGGWMKLADENNDPKRPYCDGQEQRNGKTGCVNGRTAVGPCLLTDYIAPLPQEYQYLSRRRGGSQVLADYCPLYGMWEHGDYRPVGSRSCLDPGHAPPSNINFAAEVYDEGSRCFEQAGPLERVSSLLDIYSERDLFSEVEGKVGGVCYQFHCTASRVMVEVADEVIRCGKEGRKQRFQYHYNGGIYKGSVVCPAYSELCQGYDCINSCSNHGTCHMGHCYCYHGYYGEDCSWSFAQRLLSCANVTCQNNGSCLDTGGEFMCSCLPGFTGSLCERELLPDPCKDVDCHGNGFCSRTNGGRDAKCNCYHGYKGRECRMVVDLCESGGRPCLNNNSCVANTTRCACSSEYWGDRCQYRVDFCRPVSPCSVGELCTHHNLTQNYSCVCPRGYTGANCSQLIVDHCAESPCSNNGTCVNQLDEFECVCPRGYKGGRCRNKANPCKGDPCGEGGRCRKAEGGQWGKIDCECYPGFHGDYCELTT